MVQQEQPQGLNGLLLDFLSIRAWLSLSSSSVISLLPYTPIPSGRSCRR